MEIWDIYDKDRNRTNRTMERGSKFRDNDYHLVVHICIFNAKGEMLIQQRQLFKEGWSNMWDITVGGSAITGESSSIAAERELSEEIGYCTDLSHERPVLTINFNDGFDDFYLLERDIDDIDKLVLQYEEVQNVKWATKEDMLQMLDDGIFVPYYRSLIELLFDMRNNQGAHSV